MPVATKVVVKVSTRSNFSYGFPSRADSSEQTELGQAVFANQAGTVFGVNAPKPARMKKIRTGGRSVSSFVSAPNRDTALTAGWTLTKRARSRGRTNTTLSKTVYVKLQVNETITIQYAWNMPKDSYDAIAAARAGLKILDVTATEDSFDLVFGGNYKPPRATNGDISCFVGPDATLPEGWTMVGGELE